MRNTSQVGISILAGFVSVVLCQASRADSTFDKTILKLVIQGHEAGQYKALEQFIRGEKAELSKWEIESVENARRLEFPVRKSKKMTPLPFTIFPMIPGRGAVFEFGNLQSMKNYKVPAYLHDFYAKQVQDYWRQQEAYGLAWHKGGGQTDLPHPSSWKDFSTSEMKTVLPKLLDETFLVVTPTKTERRKIKSLSFPELLEDCGEMLMTFTLENPPADALFAYMEGVSEISQSPLGAKGSYESKFPEEFRGKIASLFMLEIDPVAQVYYLGAKKCDAGFDLIWNAKTEKVLAFLANDAEYLFYPQFESVHLIKTQKGYCLFKRTNVLEVEGGDKRNSELLCDLTWNKSDKKQAHLTTYDTTWMGCPERL